MPPTVGAEWMIDWLFQAGPVANDGIGVRGLSWMELQAWRDLTETWADAWEMATLHRLSAEYAYARDRGSEKDCEPYWSAADVGEAVIEQSQRAGATLAAIFGGMSRRQSGQAI
jgi:hypothetical protein